MGESSNPLARKSCHERSALEATSILNDVRNYVTLGHELVSENRLKEAEACFRMALSLDNSFAMAHNNLAWVMQLSGDILAAERGYRKALELEPNLPLARRNLANLLSRSDRFAEANLIWRRLAEEYPSDRDLINDMIHNSLLSGELGYASEYALRNAALARGSEFYDVGAIGLPPPVRIQPEPFLTRQKLYHDLEQLRHLEKVGLLDERLQPFVARIVEMIADLKAKNITGRIEMCDKDFEEIGKIYSRILYLRTTGRVEERALSSGWDRHTVVEECTANPLRVVVIDDFLTQEALDNLRAFCMDSTIWFANRYAHGRLGAFFREGFSCPLLMQIAEELRAAMPSVIKPEFALEQVWAFKYAHHQPKTTAHADFAAVNVNFWITPSEANLDPHGGGMLISDVEAPLDWKFDDYNRDGSRIEEYLRQRSATWLNIPYRQNRAVIFDSDLFHATAPLNFKSGYENRRINVTMLYGKREADFRNRSSGLI